MNLSHVELITGYKSSKYLPKDEWSGIQFWDKRDWSLGRLHTQEIFMSFMQTFCLSRIKLWLYAETHLTYPLRMICFKIKP